MARLNLGVGHNSDLSPDVVNVDWKPFRGVNVVADIDTHPWPFPDQTFTDVRAVHVFEHLRYPLGFMADAHRVLQTDGTLRLYVPHWQSENSFTDPTHRRHCTERTWDYWCIDTQLYNESVYAGSAVFVKVSVVRDGDDIHAVLRKVPYAGTHRSQLEGHQ